MKHLSDRYTRVMQHNGLDICTLRAAVPSNGDELGYKIDNTLFSSMVFNGVGEGMEAIDALKREEERMSLTNKATEIAEHLKKGAITKHNKKMAAIIAEYNGYIQACEDFAGELQEWYGEQDSEGAEG